MQIDGQYGERGHQKPLGVHREMFLAVQKQLPGPPGNLI